ncbi:hypothetical protein K7432_013104 [Basidiobolus ranarum]|uniref:Uncharacterized protein n=1 Tax=Basidiobolus ranarum TaxID=34480 RepID=A0ABR2WJR2_9FUNG
MLRLSLVTLITTVAMFPLMQVTATSACNTKVTAPSVPWYVKKEEFELHKLYKAALKEGGQVNVFAGGDMPNAAASMVEAFEKKFPGTKLNITVNLSKYYDELIDKQLALGGDASEPDMTHLQTVQNFPHINPLALTIFTALAKIRKATTGPPIFTSSQILSAPRFQSLKGLLKPELKDGKIIYTYPHDDDSVLYQFMRLIKQNGLDWFKHFLAQKPQAVRGTYTPAFYTTNGTSTATFNTMGSLNSQAGDALTTIVPKKTFFQSWTQMGAIFKKAKHPATAKLYAGWFLRFSEKFHVYIMVSTN